MDYKELAKKLASPSWWELEDDSELTDAASAAITELIPYKEAIERMGTFGRLFLKYTGDPRGMTGRAGAVKLEEEAVIMQILTDVDGGNWRPVNEEVLQDLIAKVVESEAKVHELETAYRLEKCEDGPECAELGKDRRELAAAEARAEKAERCIASIKNAVDDHRWSLVVAKVKAFYWEKEG